MELNDYQKGKLPDIQKRIKHEFDRVWGLLPPSNERHEIMVSLRKAEKKIQEMLESSELKKGE